MTVFDFNEGGTASVTLNSSGTFFTRPEEIATVTFTLSATTVNGNAYAYGGGATNTATALVLSQNSGDGDVFKLAATSIGGGAGFSGTAMNFGFLSVAQIWTIKFTGTGGTQTRVVNPGATALPSAVSGTFTGITFTSSTSSALIIDSLTAEIACFCAGTSIATPDGAVPVETLQAGDRVLTACGGETTVQWLGRQQIAPRLTHPAKVNPIRISAGALSPGLPARDLCVSPDHALEIDGLLINASALVNGTSIHQVSDMPLDGFTYYHVETETHELILAEGCAAESYLDIPDRS
ncbi:MAG: Hint domain-containing protein, partial [Rhodobacteraceae bacterium]|nr:Hint domain-containing protein [Paracoccaceae bacterium]